MNWFFVLVIGFFPVTLLFFAPTLTSLAAAFGVSAGLGLWALHGENANRLYPLAGFLGGLLTMWLAGMLGPDLFTITPLLAMVVAYGAMMRHPEGFVPPWLLLFLAVMVIGLGYFAEGNQGEGGSIGPVSRIVVFGDSLTAGVPNDGVDRLWPIILRERLGQGTEVVSFAYPGDTAGGSLDRWVDVVRNGRWHPDRQDWEPELVVLLLGGNDILRRRGAAALRQDLERWTGELDRHPGTSVLMVEVPSNPLTGSYRGTWRSVASGRPGYFWTSDRILRGIIGNRALTLADGIHLNQAGHEVLAEGIHERITR